MPETVTPAALDREALIRHLSMTPAAGPAGTLYAGPELGEWVSLLVDRVLDSLWLATREEAARTRQAAALLAAADELEKAIDLVHHLSRDAHDGTGLFEAEDARDSARAQLRSLIGEPPAAPERTGPQPSLPSTWRPCASCGQIHDPRVVHDPAREAKIHELGLCVLGDFPCCGVPS